MKTPTYPHQNFQRVCSISLAQVMLESGPACVSRDFLPNILYSFDLISESDIAQVLGMMAITQLSMISKSGGFYEDKMFEAWNYIEFVNIVVEIYPYLNWTLVIQELDYPEFFVGDTTGVELICRCFYHATKNTLDFPVYLFFKAWDNVPGYLSFIRYALLTSDLLSFSRSGKQILLLEDVESHGSSPYKYVLVNMYAQQWNSLDLIRVLCLLADTGYGDQVQGILDLGVRQSPELLCLGLGFINPSRESMLMDVLTKLTMGFLLGQSNSSVVLPRLWKVNSQIMIQCMVEMYQKDASKMARFLDICQDLKILGKVLDVRPYWFSISMALFASRREYLNLEKWLGDSIRDKGEMFINGLIEFVSEKCVSQNNQSVVSADKIKIIARILGMIKKPEIDALLKKIQPLLKTDDIPEIYNHPLFVQYFGTQYPGDIEDEANTCYEKIYSHEMSIEDVMERMMILKQSTKARDQQVFSCMVHNLLDEYRFFPKYPERELELTGMMFGEMVQKGIVEGQSLGIAVRFVLDAVKEPEGKMFNFGIIALDHFRNRLCEWPSLCYHLNGIRLLNKYPELVQIVKKTLQDHMNNMAEYMDKKLHDIVKYLPPIDLDPGKEKWIGFSVLRDSSFNDEVSRFHSKYASDPSNEQIRNQIWTLVDRLLREEESKEDVAVLKNRLDVRYMQWISQQLVREKIMVDSGVHGKCIGLIVRLENEVFEEHVRLETYVRIREYLDADKTMVSSSERSLLKNLGLWLGRFTLQRDIPILFKHLPIKELLLEGYETDRLIVVIPFVCKVLESSGLSRIFNPNNPWIRNIMNLLVEMYRYGNLKLNLRFEIEMVCRTLRTDMDHIPHTMILRERALDCRSRALGTDTAWLLSGMGFPSDMDDLPLSISGLQKHVVFNASSIPLYTTYPILKKVVILAMDFAIREVGRSMIDRTVGISIVTTRELIRKDFQQCRDETQVREIGKQLVRFLTGNVVLGTCREGLRISISNYLQTFSQMAGLETILGETMLMDIVEDNLDLGCMYLEKTAIKKSETELDLSSIKTGVIEHVDIPEKLRIGKNGPDLEDIGVYRELKLRESVVFGDIECVDVMEIDVREFDRVSNVLGVQNREGGVMSLGLCMDQFMTHLLAMDRIISQNPNASFSSFPSDHELRMLMKQILLLALNSPNRDDACIMFSQKIIHVLYKIDSILGIEVHVVLLDKLCELSVRVTREVTSWIIYAGDDRKYIVPVTVAFFLSGLVNLLEYSVQLARDIRMRKTSTVEFSISLIRRCVLVDPVICLAFDFLDCIQALEYVLEDPGPLGTGIVNGARELLKSIRYRIGGSEDIGVIDVNVGCEYLLKERNADVGEQINGYLDEWGRLCGMISATDKSFFSFIHQLFRHGFFRNVHMLELFFSVSLERVLKRAVENRMEIEWYCRLLVFIVRGYPEDAVLNRMSKSQKMELVARFLYVCGQTVKREKDVENVSRLMIVLIGTFYSQERHFGQLVKSELIGIFGQFLHACRPELVPSFCFGWLEVVANRNFLVKAMVDSEDGWSLFQTLLADLFRFLGRLIVDPLGLDMEAVQMYFEGVLRMMLVLLHDFPEFLAFHCFDLVDVIPLCCIQLRNLVLSAFPRSFKLPDPFGLDFESEFVDAVVSDPPHPAFQRTVLNKPYRATLLGSEKSIRSLNRFVLGLAKEAISGGDFKARMHASTETLMGLLGDGDDEFRYLVISSMVNHLRYPNTHTRYFGMLVLRGFLESGVRTKEQIVRVMMERLVANRPHPWGLLAVFMEMVRKPKYSFWTHGFTKASPEIERLFDSVGKSCMVPRIH